jgi:hypothetical protein
LELVLGLDAEDSRIEALITQRALEQCGVGLRVLDE